MFRYLGQIGAAVRPGEYGSEFHNAPLHWRRKLILIDDHAIMRDGLRALLELERDIDVIGEAGTVDEGISLSKRLQPDVAIMDISFPAGSAIDAIALLRRECEAIRIVVLTVHNSDECLQAAVLAGAFGFVAKSSPYGVLLKTIRSAASRNEQAVQAIPAARLRGKLAVRQYSAPMRQLTTRERQVLVGVAQGYSSKQIAARLDRSVKTILKHRSNMMRKLSLHDASAVTRFAIANGFLAP